jgi:phage-related protein
MTPKFSVLFLEEAAEFLDQIDEKARAKIIYNIRKSQVINDNELFKKLNLQIWEFRTLYKKINYRLFAFWDKAENVETVVIATHGLIKKTDKTPLPHLEKAEKLRKQYFEQKIEDNENSKKNEDLLVKRNYR